MVNESVPSGDGQLNDLQRHDLLTGEPRYVEDDIRNSYFGIFFGLGALAAMIIATIMAWKLRSRMPNKTFTWHGIWTILAAVLALVVVVWACKTGPAIKAGRQPNTLVIVVIFLLSLFFTVYLMVETVWYIFFRQIMYDYIVGLKTNDPAFRNRFGDDTLDDAMEGSRRLIWWCIFSTLVGAGCFAYIAYASRSIVWNRYQLTRYGLYFVLAFMVLSAWIMVYWAEESFEYEGFFDNDDSSLYKNTRYIKALAITALVVAIVAAIINLLKIKLGYFIIGIIFIMLFVATTGAAGYLWRQVRLFETKEQSYNNSSSCQYTMQTIHEDDFMKGFCPVSGGKYLPVGQTCNKDFLVSRWEDSYFNDIRSLNPVCCLTAKYFYIWPFMQLAYWTLALTIIFGIAGSFCMYLSDTSEYLTNANKSIVLGDILGMILIAGLLIAWGIYYLARDKNSVRKNDTYNQLAAFNDPSRSLEGFEVVPRGVILESNPDIPIVINTDTTGRVCFSYDELNMPYPTFNNNSATCGDTNFCSVRVAISSINAEIISTNPVVAISPGANTRNNFFPQCTNNLTGYAMAYGTISQVRNYLSGLVFCVTNFSIVPTFAFYKDQVSTATINNNGLTSNETLSFDISNQNGALCYSEFPNSTFVGANIAACNSNATCRISAAAISRVKFRTLKGRLYFILNGQRRYDIHNQLSVFASSGTYPVGNNEALFENGIFIIRDVPIYSNTSYILTLRIRDTAGVFLNKSVDVKVNSVTANNEIAAGDIRLLTKNSSICSVNDTVCKNAQLQLNGNLYIIIEDGSVESLTSTSIQRVPGANIGIAVNHTALGTPFISTTSNENGAATVSNIPYNSYTVFASKTGYDPNLQLVDLQEPTNYLRPIVLTPSLADYDAKITAAMLTPQTDYDLILEMRSESGAECEVSPYYKYCAYSAHANDITNGPGEEDIYVRRLTVSTYNAYVRQSAPYNENCNSYDYIKDNAYRHTAAIPWSHVQSTTAVPLQAGTIATHTFFDDLIEDLDSIETQVSVYPIASSSESDVQAAVPKRVINFDGIPLYGADQPIRNSSFVLEDQNQDQNLSNRTNSTSGNLPIDNGTNNSVCNEIVNCTSNGTNCSVKTICNFDFEAGNYSCRDLQVCSEGFNCSGQNTTYQNCTNNTTPVVINNTCDLVDNRIIFCTVNTSVAASERGISSIRNYFYILNTDPNTNVTESVNETVLLNGSNETVNETNTTANGSGYTLNATKINTSTIIFDGNVFWSAKGNSTQNNTTSGCLLIENFTGVGGPTFDGDNVSEMMVTSTETCGNNTTQNNSTIVAVNYLNGTQESTTTSSILNPDGSRNLIVEYSMITPGGINITNSSNSSIKADGTLNSTVFNNTIVYPNGTTESFGGASSNVILANYNRTLESTTNTTTSSNGTNTTYFNETDFINYTNGSFYSAPFMSTKLYFPNGTNQTIDNYTTYDNYSNGTNVTYRVDKNRFFYPNGTMKYYGLDTRTTTTPDNLTTIATYLEDRLTPSSLLEEGYIDRRYSITQLFNGTNDTIIDTRNSTFNRVGCVNTTTYSNEHLVTRLNQSNATYFVPIIDENSTMTITVVTNDSSNASVNSEVSNATCIYLNNITDYLPFDVKDEEYFRELTTHLIGVNITVEFGLIGVSSDSGEYSNLSNETGSKYFNPAASRLSNFTKTDQNTSVSTVSTTEVLRSLNRNVTSEGVFNNTTDYFLDKTEPNESTTQYTNTTIFDDLFISNVTDRISTRTGTGNSSFAVLSRMFRYNKTDLYFSNISSHDNSSVPVVIPASTLPNGTIVPSFLDFSGSSNDTINTTRWRNETLLSDLSNTTVNNSSVYLASFNSNNTSLLNFSNTTNFSNITIYANGTNITNQTNFTNFSSISPASNGTYNNSTYLNLTNPNGELTILHAQGNAVLGPKNFSNTTLNNETNKTNFTDFGFSLNITYMNYSWGANDSTNNSTVDNTTIYDEYLSDNTTDTNRFWYRLVFSDRNTSDHYNNSKNGSTLTAQNYSFIRSGLLDNFNTSWYNDTFNYSNRTFFNNTTINVSEFQEEYFSTNNTTLDVVNVSYWGNNTTEFFNRSLNKSNTTVFVNVCQEIGYVTGSTRANLFNRFQRTIPSYNIANNTIKENGFLRFNITNFTSNVTPFVTLVDNTNVSVGVSYFNVTNHTEIVNLTNGTGIGFNTNSTFMNFTLMNNSTLAYDNNTSLSLFFIEKFSNVTTKLNQSDPATGGTQFGSYKSTAANVTTSNLNTGANISTNNYTSIDWNGEFFTGRIINNLTQLSDSMDNISQSLDFITTDYTSTPQLMQSSLFSQDINFTDGTLLTESNESSITVSDVSFFEYNSNYTGLIEGNMTDFDEIHYYKQPEHNKIIQHNFNTSLSLAEANLTYDSEGLYGEPADPATSPYGPNWFVLTATIDDTRIQTDPPNNLVVDSTIYIARLVNYTYLDLSSGMANLLFTNITRNYTTNFTTSGIALKNWTGFIIDILTLDNSDEVVSDPASFQKYNNITYTNLTLEYQTASPNAIRYAKANMTTTGVFKTDPSDESNFILTYTDYRNISYTYNPSISNPTTESDIAMYNLGAGFTVEYNVTETFAYTFAKATGVQADIFTPYSTRTVICNKTFYTADGVKKGTRTGPNRNPTDLTNNQYSIDSTIDDEINAFWGINRLGVLGTAISEPPTPRRSDFVVRRRLLMESSSRLLGPTVTGGNYIGASRDTH